MRKILSLLIMLLLLISCTTNPEKPTISAPPEEGVEVIYFHGKQRCLGCVAIENLTKEVIENDFAEEVNEGKVVFYVIDYTKPENEAIAEKYEAAWSSLYVTQHKAGKETIHDMTEFGFSYAKGEPEVFKQGLKEKIENSLK